MLSAQQTFVAQLESVPAARLFLRRTLTAWRADDYEWAASQVLTELATNAVLHARTTFVVEITLADERLRLCLLDGSPRIPLMRHHSENATTGRGLGLVTSIATEWGTEMRTDGKTIWVTLSPSDGTQWADVDDLLAGVDTDTGDSPRPRAGHRPPTAMLRFVA